MRLGEVLWLELVLILGRIKVDDWDLVGRSPLITDFCDTCLLSGKTFNLRN